MRFMREKCSTSIIKLRRRCGSQSNRDNFPDPGTPKIYFQN